MNINVALPVLMPNQLHPQVEAAQTDNRRAELIPQARQGQSATSESDGGSRREKDRSSQAGRSAIQGGRDTDPLLSVQSALRARVEAVGEERQHGQQERRQQQSPQGKGHREPERVVPPDVLPCSVTTTVDNQAIQVDLHVDDHTLSCESTLERGRVQPTVLGASGPGVCAHRPLGVLSACMAQRNLVIAARYRYAVSPAAASALSVQI